MKLAYKLWKSQQTEAGKITLLHGMGGTGVLWRPIAALLEEHYSVLAPDQRAHGNSQSPDLTSFAPIDFGQDLIETLDSLQFHPTWLIGHSMGVRSATAAASIRPDWIRGLILVDLGFAGPAGGGLGEELADFLRLLPLHFESRSEAREFMNQHCPDPSMGHYLMAVAITHPDQSLSFPFDKNGLIKTLHAVRDSSIREWIQTLGEKKMPILVLRGKNSLVWAEKDYQKEKERYANFNTIEFKEVANTGHGLPFEKRTEFLSIILDFIHRH